MSDVQDLSKVKGLLHVLDENDEFSELVYSNGGESFTHEDYPEIPDGWAVHVHEINTDSEYDSYGNSSVEDGYIIFRVTDGTEEQLYLLPVSYQSYNGWDYDLYKVTKTEKREKIVTTWEWARD